MQMTAEIQVIMTKAMKEWVEQAFELQVLRAYGTNWSKSTQNGTLGVIGSNEKISGQEYRDAEENRSTPR
jgi:hypothetical protein